MRSKKAIFLGVILISLVFITFKVNQSSDSFNKIYAEQILSNQDTNIVILVSKGDCENCRQLTPLLWSFLENNPRFKDSFFELEIEGESKNGKLLSLLDEYDIYGFPSFVTINSDGTIKTDLILYGDEELIFQQLNVIFGRLQIK